MEAKKEIMTIIKSISKEEKQKYLHGVNADELFYDGEYFTDKIAKRFYRLSGYSDAFVPKVVVNPNCCWKHDRLRVDNMCKAKLWDRKRNLWCSNNHGIVYEYLMPNVYLQIN